MKQKGEVKRNSSGETKRKNEVVESAGHAVVVRAVNHAVLADFPVVVLPVSVLEAAYAAANVKYIS